MIIDCISDLHGFYPQLEGGDLLIVAGDLTATDTKQEFEKFVSWLYNQKYNKIIVIAGNHDNVLKYDDNLLLFFSGGKIEYLCDSGTEFEGLTIWGSPWTPWFHGVNPKCKAFTVDTEEELAEKFALIPSNTNILITHSPPYMRFDETEKGESVGSTSLDEKVFYLSKLQLHVFGHVHECGGRIDHRTRNASDKHISVNASYVNERYQPVNKPIRVNI